MGCNVSKDVKVEDQGAQGPPLENGIDNKQLSEDEAAKKIQAQFRGYQARKSLRSSESSTPQPPDDKGEEQPNKTAENKRDVNKEMEDTSKIETSRQGAADAQEEGTDSTKPVNPESTAPKATEEEVDEEEVKEKADDEVDEKEKAPQEEGKHQEENTAGDTETASIPPEEQNEVVENAVESHQEECQEEVDIDLNDPEVEKAAVKIQATFRGYKVRKEVLPGEEGEGEEQQEQE